MKKLLAMLLVLAMVLSLAACGSSSKESAGVPAEDQTNDQTNNGGADGYLSFLNLSEEQVSSRLKAEIPAYHYLEEQGVMEYDGKRIPHNGIIFYDSLDSMLMGLMSGDVDAIDVPDCTAKYLCATNDQVKQTTFYYPEKAEGFSQELLDRLCNGYSFMMLEENSAMRDQFNQVIAEMKADGTMDELIKTHITDASKSGEPVAVAFEEFEGDPIKVAVTGSLPPMDYITADGSFAGFNTAILAEIGKRLGKNIELVQVDSPGRALALAEGNVDVVFWTRGMPENLVDDGVPSMSTEEFEAYVQENRAKSTEEEIAIMKSLSESLLTEVFRNRDKPEGTVITDPYYTDLNVLVVKK
jgi:polar amino acid transport system substrate-binding protein